MIRKPNFLEQATNWLTGQRAPAPSGQDLVKNVTRSISPELLYRVRQRPYDPKLLELFQPDSLARMKGWGVYEDMLDDAQVRAVNTIKRYAPVSNGWQMTPADDSTAASEINTFCTACVENMEKTLEEATAQVLEATFTGLTISETLYRVEKRGMYAGRLMLSDIQTRPPAAVDVDFDDSGRVVAVIQADSFGSWGNERFNPFKFIIYSYNARYGSPYGRGDGRAVYKHWWSKDFLLKAWASYMDKYGAPLPIGRQTSSMSEDDASRFLDLLEAIQHQGFAVLPENWNIDWAQAPGGNANAQGFLTAIEWHDSMISKAILGSTLSTDQSQSGAGSFAMARVHADTRDLILQKVKRDAEDVIVRRQILRRLVRLNYGREAAMMYTPKFIFSPPDLSEMKDMAGIIQQLVTAQVIDPKEPWIRDRLVIPSSQDVADDTHEAKLKQQESDHEIAANDAQNELDISQMKHDQQADHQQQQHEVSRRQNKELAQDAAQAPLPSVVRQQLAVAKAKATGSLQSDDDGTLGEDKPSTKEDTP